MSNMLLSFVSFVFWLGTKLLNNAISGVAYDLLVIENPSINQTNAETFYATPTLFAAKLSGTLS